MEPLRERAPDTCEFCWGGELVEHVPGGGLWCTACKQPAVSLRDPPRLQRRRRKRQSWHGDGDLEGQTLDAGAWNVKYRGRKR